MAGLLIVNADDWGASVRVTDTTLVCYDAGALSSVSAMVWMRDSERAAALAREHEIPAGLHLNLTLPFDSPDVPAAIRERQRALIGRFGPESWRESEAPKPDRKGIRDAIRDQLDRFRELYGDPTHLDGHHHVHVNADVVEELPAGLPIRPVLSVPSRAGESSRRHRALSRRFRMPRWAFAFEHVHPALGGEGLHVLALADREPLEIMAHPAMDAQEPALVSSPWLETLERHRVGSYRELGPA